MERGNNRKSEGLFQTVKGKKNEGERETGEERRREKKNRSMTVPLKGSAEVCTLT